MKRGWLAFPFGVAVIAGALASPDIVSRSVPVLFVLIIVLAWAATIKGGASDLRNFKSIWWPYKSLGTKVAPSFASKLLFASIAMFTGFLVGVFGRACA